MFAHTKIEVTGPRGGVHIYQRGDEIPDDVDGIDELKRSGAVRKDAPRNDPADEQYSPHLHGPADVVDVQGTDNGQAGDNR